MKHLPYFKFHANDWLSALNVQAMNNAQRGAYIMLLAQAWTQETCSLPNDRLLLQRLCHWQESDDLFHPVLACFVALDNTRTRLINKRQYQEFVEATAYRLKQQAHGQQGAEKRWGNKPVKVTKARLEKGKTAFPDDWKLDPAQAEGWRKFGIDPFVEFATFRDHARTNDRRCHDWEAAWRNWARKAIKMKE